MDGDKMAIALISNRHVFCDGNGQIELRFHSTTDEKARFDLGDAVILRGGDFSQKYVPHPDPGVDLGAAIVNAIGEQGKGKLLAPSQVATQAELDALRVGDSIWFVGYPDGWRDELHNLPLMRRGSLASLPRLDFDGRPEFVIDAQAFPGSSGSPVFAQVGDEMRLIGVLAETRVQQSAVRGPAKVLGPFTVDEVVGLGIVIRATELDALVAAVRSRVQEIITAQSAGRSSTRPDGSPRSFDARS